MTDWIPGKVWWLKEPISTKIVVGPCDVEYNNKHFNLITKDENVDYIERMLRDLSIKLDLEYIPLYKVKNKWIINMYYVDQNVDPTAPYLWLMVKHIIEWNKCMIPQFVLVK